MTSDSPRASLKLFYLLLVSLIVVMDQLSKWFITEMLFKPRLGQDSTNFLTWISEAPGRISPIKLEVTSFYNMVMVWNEGVSFGMMNSMGDQGPLVLIGLSLVISLFLIVWMLGSKSHEQGIALALVVGGAIGNVIDRARFGAVIDFIDVHIMGYHWPAFNIADSMIVIGIAFVIIHSLFFDKESPSLVEDKKEEKS